MTTLMHARAAFPHPLGLSPDNPENLMQLLDRLRREARGNVRRMRRAASDRVDALIAFLDATEGDPDIEDDTEDNDLSLDEPDLGAAPAMNQSLWGTDGNLATHRMNCDCEGGDIIDEPHDDDWPLGVDCEPSLGWPEDRMRQGPKTRSAIFTT